MLLFPLSWSVSFLKDHQVLNKPNRTEHQVIALFFRNFVFHIFILHMLYALIISPISAFYYPPYPDKLLSSPFSHVHLVSKDNFFFFFFFTFSIGLFLLYGNSKVTFVIVWQIFPALKPKSFLDFFRIKGIPLPLEICTGYSNKDSISSEGVQ